MPNPCHALAGSHVDYVSESDIPPSGEQSSRACGALPVALILAEAVEGDAFGRVWGGAT